MLLAGAQARRGAYPKLDKVLLPADSWAYQQTEVFATLEIATRCGRMDSVGGYSVWIGGNVGGDGGVS
jgi:hypothetical protein